MTAVSDRLAAKPRLRGVRVRLPAEADVIGAAGVDFVLLDLIEGPGDETALAAHVRLGHAVGLLVLAAVEDPGTLRRLARLGVDAAVMPTRRAVDSASGIAIVDTEQLTIVGDPGERSETAFTALDLETVRRMAISRFSTAGADPAEPVVLLAGQLGDVSIWDDVVSGLPTDRRYVALRIDLDDTIEGMAQTVLAAAPDRFALVGHSLGGIVALQICRDAPARVTRLALLNSSGRGPSPTQLDTWMAQRREIDDGRFAELVDSLAEANLSPDHPPAHRQRWRQMARIVGPDGLRRQLSAQSSRPDSLPTLAGLKLPVLVLSGSDDSVCRPELQAELVAGLPNAHHVTLAGVGHMSPLAAPTAVAEQLSRWLG